MTVTLALLGYAAAVAVLSPRLLTQATALRRSPRLAVVVWQAAAVSVLVAVALAAAACVADPRLLRMCLAALTGSDGLAGVAVAAAGLGVPVLLFVHLGLTAARQARGLRAERRRHVELLSMIGRHDPRLGATIVPSTAAVAYCVPGTDRVVVTHGAVATLHESELRAVLAHERAHLAGRHHLLVAWAGVLARAFPRVPVFRDIAPATADLVELLADDTTLRRASADSLAVAIAALSTARVPALGLAASGGAVLSRVQRLLDPPAPLPVAARISGAGAAIAMLVLPVLLAAVPALFAAGLVVCPVLLG